MPAPGLPAEGKRTRASAHGNSVPPIYYLTLNWIPAPDLPAGGKIPRE